MPGPRGRARADAAGRRPLARPLAAALLLVLASTPGACAAWRPLAPAAWEQATDRADLFRTRLRVTRLDGRRVYLEQPRWTTTTLHGVYPAGWPAVPAAESLLAIPRDSIVRVDRLESDRRRTALYLAGLGVAGAAVAIVAR